MVFSTNYVQMALLLVFAAMAVWYFIKQRNWTAALPLIAALFLVITVCGPFLVAWLVPPKQSPHTNTLLILFFRWISYGSALAYGCLAWFLWRLLKKKSE